MMALSAVSRHDLHLVFFPAQQAFIHKDLPDGRGIHARAAEMDVIFAVIGHAAARATHGKGGADDRGQADFFEIAKRDCDALFKVFLPFVALNIAPVDLILGRGEGHSDNRGLGVFDAKAIHRFAEQFAVFGHLNSGGVWRRSSRRCIYQACRLLPMPARCSDLSGRPSLAATHRGVPWQ